MNYLVHVGTFATKHAPEPEKVVVRGYASWQDAMGDLRAMFGEPQVEWIDVRPGTSGVFMVAQAADGVIRAHVTSLS